MAKKGQTIFETIESRHTQGVHQLLGPMDVLFMKSTKCEWGGKCKYCSYWHDNTKDPEVAHRINDELLNGIQFKNKVVSISPSASWFDIPIYDRNHLLNVMKVQQVEHYISESTWSYRGQFVREQELLTKCYPSMRFWHKMGIETFDNTTRAMLGKDYVIDNPLDVFKYTKNVILLVGSIYHTKDVIDRDIELGLEHADLLEVNIMSDSFSPVPLESREMIEYVHTKWAPVLRTISKVIFTEDPASAWGATINPKTIPIRPVGT